MLSRRFSILVADRTTGVTRRMTFSVRALLVVCVLMAGLMALPVLMGLGARWSASVEIAQLQSALHALRLENDSYRAVTGELATQISSLQGVITDLDDRNALGDAQRKAIQNLPPVVRNRAVGGASPSATRALLTAAMATPDSTFGVLRELLGVLETKLQLVRTDVERFEALAGATPSIWPVIGWLSDGFGRRDDPFTGERAQHLGLDISADKGEPVYATANGTVQSAGYHTDFGNLVIVAHEFGLTTRYAHLSRFAVKAGARVQRGDVIGYVGSTGRSTAPHLHYEVWANGRPLNPIRLLTQKPQ